jgi:hypothetical protein
MSAVLSAILSLYIGHAQSLDSVSLQQAHQELQRLFAPVRIELIRSQPSHDVSRIVAVALDGACSLDSLPAGSRDYSGTEVLGETSVSSDRVLPYVQVNCDSLIRALAPSLQPLSMPLRRVVFGRALGRVMAHELYHILSQRKDHEQTGAAKSSFSLEDLTARRFEFEFPTIAAATAGVQTQAVEPGDALLTRKLKLP